MLPLILAGAAIIGFGAMVMGCGGKEEKKPEPTPPPNPCDTFQRAEGLDTKMDDEAFDALKYISLCDKANYGKLSLANWNLDTRIFVGAMDPLYRGARAKGKLEDAIPYDNNVAGMFGQIFKKAPEAKDDGFLMLFAGAAPTSGNDAEKVVNGAMAVFAGADPSQKDFTELIKAIYLFNVAADVCTEKTRFNDLTPRANLSAADRKAAQESLKKAEDIYKAVKRENLNDQQQKWYERLGSAIETLRKKLKGGGGGGCTGPNCGNTPPPAGTVQFPRD